MYVDIAKINHSLPVVGLDASLSELGVYLVRKVTRDFQKLCIGKWQPVFCITDAIYLHAFSRALSTTFSTLNFFSFFKSRLKHF